MQWGGEAYDEEEDGARGGPGGQGGVQCQQQ